MNTEKTSDIIAGAEFTSNNCGTFVIEKYNKYSSVHVKFSRTGYQTETTVQNIRKKTVRDPFAPVSYGVGFVGIGAYNSKKDASIYKRWNHMLKRCYNDKYTSKHKTYKDCTVCNEWHNFQNFAEWFDDNYPNDGNKYDLDKDLLILGNKVYSPETCIFITPLVNSFVTDAGAVRGECMIGVSIRKRDGRYLSQCNNPFLSRSEVIGTFISELPAHMAWRKRKIQHAKSLIDKCNHECDKIALTNYMNGLVNNTIHPY